MDIRTILVNVDVDLDGASATSLTYAIALARRFDAELIGLAAETPHLLVGGVDGGFTAAEVYAAEYDEIQTRLAKAEEMFSSLIPAGIKSQWRAFVSSPSQCLIENALGADLIITGSPSRRGLAGSSRLNLGEIVLSSGRPVLEVGEGLTEAKLDTVVIGWKDTREARRAVVDAMPFLQRARKVLALTITEGDSERERSSLNSLVSWLARHGVAAGAELDDNREGLDDILQIRARSEGADLLVTGGYGHSRMREWLFGGMTRSVLRANTLNRMLSN